MYSRVEKPKKNKSRVVASSVTQPKRNTKQRFGFVDNRKTIDVQHGMSYKGGTNISSLQPIQCTITHGQAAKVALLNRAKMGSYNSQRLAKALHTFMLHHQADFPELRKKDKDLRNKLNDIIDELGIGYPAGWHEELKLQKAESYRQISGTNGSVPADIVEELAKRWRISEDTIRFSVSKIAAARGDNGVKILTGASKGYTAELKIMSMGDDRVFSKSATSPYTFDTIDSGLH